MADKKPTGRPTLLTDKTAALIVAKLANGCYIEEAAAACGLHRTTVHAWQRDGAKIRARLEAGETTLSQLKPNERRYLDFLNAVDRAEDEWFARANDTLDELAFGGRTVTSKTVKILANGDVEETTKTETLLPNPQVMQWRMERKRPAIYGRRAPLDINLGGQPDNPLTVEVSVDAIAAKILEAKKAS